jgi:hypothetical protein
MLHLGFRCYFLGSSANRIRRLTPEQQLAFPCQPAVALNTENTWMEFAGFALPPIRSRASQNAAAILFDADTVDIR